MSIEKIFKLSSLAVLGLMALACVPNAKAPPIEVSADIELESVTEIELINSGQFQPFRAGLDDQPDAP
jgi:hypothetical protein